MSSVTRQAPYHLDCPYGCHREAGRSVVRNGSTRGRQRYKCRICGRTFDLADPISRGLTNRLAQKLPSILAELQRSVSLSGIARHHGIVRATVRRVRERALTFPEDAQRIAGQTPAPQY